MLTLIIGAAASGKSEYAEQYVMSMPGKKVYVATMEPSGKVAEERIKRHRRLRANKDFETIERYTDLNGLDISSGPCHILLECLGNLLANEMFNSNGRGAKAVLDGVLSLNRRCLSLTIVTNEVCSGGADYEEQTMEYIRQIGQIQSRIAQEADRVIEIVCGIPNILK